MLSLCLTHSSGTKRPKPSELQRLFRLLEHSDAATLEDPAEDILCSAVHYSGTTYRVFEGLWEGNAFHLQPFCDVVSTMPMHAPFLRLREQIDALLQLSDCVAARRGLQRYSGGHEFPLNALSDALLADVRNSEQAVVFSTHALAKLGISRELLSPFTTTLQAIRASVHHGYGLDYSKPLLTDGNRIFLINPAAISPAIRAYIAQWATGPNADILQLNTEQAILKLLAELPKLNVRRSPMPDWTHTPDASFLDCLMEIDHGRMAQLLVVHNPIRKEHASRIGSTLDLSDDVNTEIEKRILAALQQTTVRPEFVEGTTLIISSGWGLGQPMAIPDVEDRWSIQLLSLYDLSTLCWSQAFESLDMFRVAEQLHAYLTNGIEIMNPLQSLMDYIGWGYTNNSAIVPATVPDAMTNMIRLMLPTNSVLDLRKHTHRLRDQHFRIDPLGNPFRVSRYLTHSFFSDDHRQPLYCADDIAFASTPRSVYAGEHTDLWLTVSSPPGSNFEDEWLFFDGFTNWLPSLCAALEDALRGELPPAIGWHIHCDPLLPGTKPDEPGVEECSDARRLVAVEVNQSRCEITTRLSQRLSLAMGHRDNHAERAVLWGFLDGVAELLKRDIDGDTVSMSVTGSTSARQIHLFEASDHADYVKEQLAAWPVYLSPYDASTARIGAGQLAGLAPGATISGRKDCTDTLGKLVDKVWERLRTKLASFDRELLLRSLLTNSLAARQTTRQWDVTRNAIRSLRPNDSAVPTESARQVWRLYLVSTTSRVLAEMAVCHGARSGGRAPGQRDLSTLMADAELMMFYGAASDAMHFGFTRPEIRIALGGVPMWGEGHADRVHEDYAIAVEEGRELRQAKYAGEDIDDPKTSPNDRFHRFNAAILAEFGFTVNSIWTIVNSTVRDGIENSLAVETAVQSDLQTRWAELVPPSEAHALIEHLVLRHRPEWSIPPEGFSWTDIVPWRFRRRLSLISKPFAQCTESTDPTLMWSAGLVHESVGAWLQSMWQGAFDPEHFLADEMRKWVGWIRDRRGAEFTLECEQSLESLGWQTWRERSLGELLKMPDLEEYGDIDVLAYYRPTGRVLLIECKQLTLAKNPSEIVRQMQEFRGLSSKDGKPDRLLRHVRRVDMVRQNPDKLETFCRGDISSIRGVIAVSNAVPMLYDTESTDHGIPFVYYQDLASVK